MQSQLDDNLLADGIQAIGNLCSGASSPPLIPAQKGPCTDSCLTTHCFPGGTAGSRSCAAVKPRRRQHSFSACWVGEVSSGTSGDDLSSSAPRCKHRSALSPLSHLTVKCSPRARWLVLKRHLCVAGDKAFSQGSENLETCTAPEMCKSRDVRD